MSFLKTLQKARQQNKKLIAILVDPDKVTIAKVKHICSRINNAPVDYLFLGGSTVCQYQTEMIAKEIKKYIQKPIVLFPGDYTHLTNHADALLFLNLISGNNPEYLINQQVKAVPFVRNTSLEVVSTGYILIDGNKETSTLKVSKTKPIAQDNIEHIKNTAFAGQLMGQQLIYLEAGSGANLPVGKDVVNAVNNSINIPIIVGGGIKNFEKINEIHQSGATLVVIGTAFELNRIFLTS